MTTGTFFSGRNRQNQKLTQQHNPPDRRLELLFFPVVIKLSRHNKKTAYFPPEPKTDTTEKLTQHHNCMVLQVHSSMYNQNLFPAGTKN